MSARGFTLVEMAVVVAILGVIAALAVPNMTPMLHTQQLEGETHGVASFLARARAEATSRRRCVRVTIPAAPARVLIAEQLNSHDCETPDPGIAQLRIDGAKPLYFEIARYTLPTSMNVRFQFPSAEKPGFGEPDQVRFRTTGRLFSNDAALVAGNEEMVLELTHLRMAGVGAKKRILVESSGYICVIRRGQNPLGVTPSFNCPP